MNKLGNMSFDEALCAAADGHFGLIGPHQCSIAEKDMMRRWKNNKQMQTVSTTGANKQFID